MQNLYKLRSNIVRNYYTDYWVMNNLAVNTLYLDVINDFKEKTIIFT